jgi:hypothetical protein
LAICDWSCIIKLGHVHAMSQKIYVDFNSRLTEERIIIPYALEGDIIAGLRVGDTVTLYDEGLEVDARWDYDSEQQWGGQVDWKTIRFL